MGEKTKENKMQAPNIFDYATGELSQDAFICWLVKLADCDGHELQSASKEFISLLFQIGGEGEKVLFSDVGAIKKLSQQKEEKIDVFFIAAIKGKDTCFIIEDKVDSKPHSGQLKKYVNHVRKTYPNPIVKIYFKTGYLFDDEVQKCRSEKEPEYKYGILDYKGIYSYLESINTQDVIFNLYREYIQRKFINKFNEGLAAFDRNESCSLKEYFVQYEFLKKLSQVCPETIGEKKSVETGTSFGVPWAEYTFVSNKDAFGPKKNEDISYRIEFRKNRADKTRCICLSVRQYVRIAAKQQKTDKLQNLKKYRVCKSNCVNGFSVKERASCFRI